MSGKKSMPNNVDVIKQLEKTIGKKLNQSDLRMITGTGNGYAADEDQIIIGLNLYNTNVSDISFIKELKYLTHLNLRVNQVSDLSPLKELKALTFLSLAENQVSDISPLKELKALTELQLYKNMISDISPLKELKALTQLWLSSNQVSDISPLKELKALTGLDLSSNQVLDLSPLKELKALTFLSLSVNQVSDILPLCYLSELKRLNVTNNKITQLPTEILQLGMEIKWEMGDYENGLYLKGNPWKIPPVEIVKQGTEAVRNYFKELEKDWIRLLESKLLIVGNGEVGKTTLMKKLKDNNFQVEEGKEKTTHGINIVPWELNCTFAEGDSDAVKIHIWDFGGQAIYHSTHQFFLTKRSLYLFVWEARKEEESRSFDYWLNIIKLLSAGSPVIVVMNKSDVRMKHIDEASFKEKFRNIVTFLQVSCVTGKGIPELTEQIRSSLGNMDHLQDQLPKVWLQIRNQLKKENKNYISQDEYFDICRKYYLSEERAEFLSDYLHDLGVILHYRHDKLLENTVILNPEWATEAVYKLSDTREILENKGRFHFDALKIYWDKTRFPRHKHAELVRLMEKFELCFPITGTDIHIVPELLPAQRPAIDFKVYKQPGDLHFQYHYDFMPEGIITRFISRMYYLIKEDHYWKNGVELRFEDSTALIISDYLNRKIKISVTGSRKNELLAITRNDFEHIHRTLNMEKNKHYDEMIPCNCAACRESGEPHLFKYEVIKKFESKNKSFMLCSISADEVSIESLLKGYQLPKPKKDLLKTLINTASQLQAVANTIKPDEDSRNGFIALLLSIHGFFVKDQTRWGRSASGKTPAAIDIKVESPDREVEAIIEAFNLKSFDRVVIDSHLTKLFGYDPSGLERNFIIVYSEAADFPGLWQKYLSHLPEIDFKYKLAAPVEEQNNQFTDIKLARTRHLRQVQETMVYHLFINMNI